MANFFVRNWEVISIAIMCLLVFVCCGIVIALDRAIEEESDDDDNADDYENEDRDYGGNNDGSGN